MIDSTSIAAHPDYISDTLRIRAFALHDIAPKGMRKTPGTENYLCLVFHSDCVLITRTQELSCPANSFYIWEPGSEQQYGNLGQSWGTSWIDFGGAALSEMMQEYQIPTNTLIEQGDTKRFERFLNLLYDELTDIETPSDKILLSICGTWCLSLSRLVKNPELFTPLPTEYVAIRRFIDTHYVEEITLASLAEKAHVSISYFSEQFKHYFGISPIKYLIRVRMQNAAYLLQDQHLSICEVGERVGFADQQFFSVSFKKYFNMSPRTMRNTLTPEAMHAKIAEEQHKREFQEFFQEGWLPIVTQDFSKDTELDPLFHTSKEFDNSSQRFPADEYVTIQQGRLIFEPSYWWLNCTWEFELTKEIKIDIVLDNIPPDGLNIAIAISGDMRHGYRLRIIGYDYVILETVINGHWEVLSRYPKSLDQSAENYRIVYWRSQQTFYAEINGQRIFEYYDPFPPYGKLHRQFAIGRFMPGGTTQIRSLQVYAKRYPKYTDILEPGRVLLRNGHPIEALEWFQSHAYNDPTLQQEAEYLISLATSDEQHEEKTTRLTHIIQSLTHPYRARALRELAFLLLSSGDISHAVDYILLYYKIEQEVAILGRFCKIAITSPHLADINLLQAELSRLPLAALDITDLDVTTLASLRGLTLKELQCAHNPISDLSPLSNMPLNTLGIAEACIVDLLPLKGLPLTYLDCAHNNIETLEPLTGIALQQLVASHNYIKDLSPLTDMPLSLLEINNNIIHDLMPIIHAPLHTLNCAYNNIIELEPLRHLTTLSYLNIINNKITDITALHNLPLEKLACSHNPISNLAPLQGTPLQWLTIYGLTLTEDSCNILLNLPLISLCCDLTTPFIHELFTGLPKLRFFNYHHRSYVKSVAEAITGNTHLRNLARRIGDIDYLVIPQPMTRADADHFCRAHGGYLACPPDEEHYQQLLQFLYQVNALWDELTYHIGGIVSHGNIIDAEGYGNTLPYTCWVAGEMQHALPEHTYAYFSIFNEPQHSWQILTDSQERHYVILAWKV